MLVDGLLLHADQLLQAAGSDLKGCDGVVSVGRDCYLSIAIMTEGLELPGRLVGQ